MDRRSGREEPTCDTDLQQERQKPQPSPPFTNTKDNIMNLALWIITGLLTVVALTGGISKTFVSKDKLAHVPGGGWTEDHTAGFVKTLGILELLAVAGLTLPAVLDMAPVLVPITAVMLDPAHGRRDDHAPPPRRANLRRAEPRLPRTRSVHRVGAVRPAILQLSGSDQLDPGLGSRRVARIRPPVTRCQHLTRCRPKRHVPHHPSYASCLATDQPHPTASANESRSPDGTRPLPPAPAGARLAGPSGRCRRPVARSIWSGTVTFGESGIFLLQPTPRRRARQVLQLGRRCCPV